MKQKFELHHGFVVDFAPVTLDHDTMGFNLRKELERAYPAPARTFGATVKVKVSADTFYYPDAGVAGDDVPSDALELETPLVVAEVISEATRAHDIVEKRPAYRAIPSLHAYVVVHDDARRIDVDTRDAGGAWTTTRYDDGIIRIGTAALAFDAIYAGTALA